MWTQLVGPPGCGKTETFNSLSGLPDIHHAATLTEAALLSGTPKKERDAGAKGGLLRQVGPFGLLLVKDFTSVLSMARDSRTSVLAALREVYDGSWTRHVGTGGGISDFFPTPETKDVAIAGPGTGTGRSSATSKLAALPAAPPRALKAANGRSRASLIYAASSPAVVSIRAGDASGTGFLDRCCGVVSCLVLVALDQVLSSDAVGPARCRPSPSALRAQPQWCRPAT